MADDNESNRTIDATIVTERDDDSSAARENVVKHASLFVVGSDRSVTEHPLPERCLPRSDRHGCKGVRHTHCGRRLREKAASRDEHRLALDVSRLRPQGRGLARRGLPPSAIRAHSITAESHGLESSTWSSLAPAKFRQEHKKLAPRTSFSKPKNLGMTHGCMSAV